MYEFFSVFPNGKSKWKLPYVMSFREPQLHLKLSLNMLFHSASAAEGALQSRPGTHYSERNCNPDYKPMEKSDTHDDEDSDYSAKMKSPEDSRGRTTNNLVNYTG